MANSSSRTPILLMILLCLAFAGVLALVLAAPEPQPDIATIAQPEDITDAAVTSPARFSMPPLGTFSEIAERPLFSRSRRPPSPQETESEEEPMVGPGAFVLTGVFLMGDDRLAFLGTQASDRVTRMREGETLDGWTLLSVQPDKVVVGSGGLEREVLLEDTLKMDNSPVRLRAQRLRAQQLRARQLRAQQARAEEEMPDQGPEGGSAAAPDDAEEPPPDQAPSSSLSPAERIAEQFKTHEQRNRSAQDSDEELEPDESVDAPQRPR